MLTVLIATRNGAHTLPRALAAHSQLVGPAGGWKLIIVDNGSEDGTKEIIQSFANRLPLTYLFEGSPGKNAALNKGLDSVEGDLIVLTDDDTLPRPDWLVQMRRAADSHASFAMFAGTVIPHWEVAPEPWILSWVKMGPVFSMTDPAWQEGPIDPVYVFGTNMAIRTEIFEAGHRFDAGIGPRAGQYAMGSETELTMRLGKAGINAWHCKEATVEHIIRGFQTKRGWILRRGILYGRGRYRVSIQQQNVDRKKILGIPGYLIKELRKKGFDVIRAKLHGDPAKVFEKRWIFNYLLGQAIEAHVLHKELQQ